MSKIIKKTAEDIKRGDFFSYVGAFKVYQAQSDARLDNILINSKVTFPVTDGGMRDNMGIRLDADLTCVIHDGFGRCNADGTSRDTEPS